MERACVRCMSRRLVAARVLKGEQSRGLRIAIVDRPFMGPVSSHLCESHLDREVLYHPYLTEMVRYRANLIETFRLSPKPKVASYLRRRLSKVIKASKHKKP